MHTIPRSDNAGVIISPNSFQKSENNDIIHQSGNKDILSHGLKGPGLSSFQRQCVNRVSMLVTSGW